MGPWRESPKVLLGLDGGSLCANGSSTLRGRAHAISMLIRIPRPTCFGWLGPGSTGVPMISPHRV